MNLVYEKIVRIVCGGDWNGSSSTPDDRDGGFGIAMVLAYLQGSNSRLGDLSKAIGIPAYSLETAYKRLQINGIFSPRSSILDDPILKFGGSNNDNSSIRAWCHIAGLASGYTGKGFTREEYASLYDQKESNLNESRA